MTWFEAFILGAVEGLTEFLPVSSTGHLILAKSLLGLKGDGIDAYLVVIQLGAILAVLTLYRNRALQMVNGVLGKDAAGLSLLLKLAIATPPILLLGKLLSKTIKAHLFAPVPVAIALIVGGIIMILIEQLIVKRRASAQKSLEEATLLDAFLIGLAQCFALIPGTSRSMCTIVGGQLRGLSNAAAAELSFLLALPALGAATLYELYTDREALAAIDGGFPVLLFGNIVAFIVAFAAVKLFVGVVNRYGMTPWGLYRILAGGIVLLLAARGMISV